MTKRKVYLSLAAVSAMVISFLLLLSINPSIQAQAPTWKFESDTQGWMPQSQITDFGIRDGALSGISIGGFPYFVSPFPSSIDADEYKVLVIEMSEQSEYEDAQVLWRGSYYNQFDMLKSARISLLSKNKFHKYYIDLGLNPQWTGITQQILIVPSMNTGEFRVKSIRIEKPTPLNMLLSAWQEFTAYETIKGSTVNTTKSQTICGRAVNYYVIFLLILTFLIAFGIKFCKARFDPSKLRYAARFGLFTIAITAAVIWVLLEARMDLDYSKTFALDLHKFWGKTIDEKRGINSQGDFYDFLAFCNKTLPERSSVNIVTPNVFFDNQAGIYLYPNIIKLAKPADYVLVYNQAIDEEKYKDFVIFAKYKENEYIMKRVAK